MNQRFVTVRPYTLGDEDCICAVIGEVWREFGSRSVPENSPDLNSIADHYQVGAGGFWVAEVGSNIVGTIGLLDVGSRHATLKRMYVLEAFRGSELGTAKELLLAALEAAHRNGIQAIYFGTPEFTMRAHSFYEKHGFEPLSQEELPPTIVIDPVDSRFYVLKI